MTTYTFIGDPSHTSVSWENPAVWSNDAVPNGPTADVVIPTIFYVAQPTKVYASDIAITVPTEIASLSIANNTLGTGALLTVDGDANVQSGGDFGGDVTIDGTLTVASGGSLFLGTVHAASFQNSGSITGNQEGGGILTAGAFTNEAGGVISLYSDFKTMAVNATSFHNLGELYSLDSTLTVTVTPGGFINLSNGVLTGGSYEAGSGGGSGQLQLNVGGVITTDAAFMSLGLNGSDIKSYNSVMSAYQPIESTLQTIAHGGVLSLEERATTWTTALTVQGTLELITQSLTTPQLTIAPGGTFEALGTVNGSVTDNGTITDLPAALRTEFKTGTAVAIDFTGAVGGSGTVVAGTLTFGAAASVNVTLSGALTLDDANDFTGSIAPQLGNIVYLPNVLLNDVTSYSYAPTDGDHGVLTLEMSTGPAITLDFTGHFDTGSFTLSNGQKISSSPPNVLITIAHAASPPHDDFLGAGVSDILLENASGQIDVGQMSGGSMALTDIFSSLGPQWKFEGNGDFLGNGSDQFLIENTGGSLGLGSVVNGKMDLSSIGTLATAWKFVDNGDFLGNGHAEFLVENGSGQVDLGQVSGGATTETQIDTLGSQWKFVGAGDFLGAGHDQAAIENTLGNVGIGTVSGSSVNFTAVGVLSSTQKIVETGDFLGDGKSDFLIDNTATGALDVGEVVNGALTLTQIDTLGSQWSFVGAGDYLGDGKDQILIENTAGNLGIGEVSGGSIHFMTVATGFSEWMFH